MGGKCTFFWLLGNLRVIESHFIFKNSLSLMETPGIFPIYLKKSYKFLTKNLHKSKKSKKKDRQSDKTDRTTFSKESAIQTIKKEKIWKVNNFYCVNWNIIFWLNKNEYKNFMTSVRKKR